MNTSRLLDTLGLWTYSAFRLPLLAVLRPRVERLDEGGSRVRVVMGHMTRNHLGSMYFGALCMGAELGPGLLAMRTIRERGNQVSLIFKEFHALFLKRVEGDALFTCTEGADIIRMVDKALAGGERVEQAVKVVATVPSLLANEPVAEFSLTLSVKRRGDA